MAIFQVIVSVISINQHTHELYITLLNRVTFLCTRYGTETSLTVSLAEGKSIFDKSQQIEKKSSLVNMDTCPSREDKPPLYIHNTSPQDGSSGGELPSYDEGNEKLPIDSMHGMPSANTQNENNATLNELPPSYYEEGREFEKQPIEGAFSQEMVVLPSNENDGFNEQQPPSYSPLYHGAQNELPFNANDDNDMPPSYDADNEKAPLGVAYNEKVTQNSSIDEKQPRENEKTLSNVSYDHESGSAMGAGEGRVRVVDMKSALANLVRTLIERFNPSIWSSNESWFLHSGLNVSGLIVLSLFVLMNNNPVCLKGITMTKEVFY